MIARPQPLTLESGAVLSEPDFPAGVRLHKFASGRFWVLRKGRILFTSKTRVAAEQWIFSGLKQSGKTASFAKRSTQKAASGATTTYESALLISNGFWPHYLRLLLSLRSFIFAFFKRA